MLVLSRKLKEVTIITTPSGEEIRVVVVDIDRGKIRLGFEADRKIKINRLELEEGYKQPPPPGKNDPSQQESRIPA